MAETKTLNTIIVLRNDSSTDWANSDVILKTGELGVSYLSNGNVMVKAGDGVHKWDALPQVESVLEDNLKLTYSFGKHKVAAGSWLDAGGKDMTMSQWIAESLKETVEPEVINYPSVGWTSGAAANSGASLEIGSYVTSVSYQGSFSDGKYECAGKETSAGLDINDTSWSVSYDGQTIEKSSGTFTVNQQLTSTTANTVIGTLSATVTLDPTDGITPVNNMGDSNSSVKITGFDSNGTVTTSITKDVKVSAYRNTWYYVGTDCTSNIDSDFIRTYGTAKNANTTSFGTVTIPAGTKRVVFAVLGDKTLNSVIDVDGQNLDVKANFTKKTVAIKGANNFTAANYSVFHFENENGIAATKYTVSIG